MDFVSASLLAEPPLISLFDQLDSCSPSSSAGPPLGKLNFGPARLGISKAPTPVEDLIDFGEKSAADELYAEVYRKNLLKFLATGGFAARKREVEVKAEEPTVLSLIDEQVFINGHLDNSKDGQGSVSKAFAVEKFATATVDHDSESSAEFEPVVCEVENELFLRLSGGVARSPSDSDESDADSARHSGVGELVCLSDEVTTGPFLFTSQGSSAKGKQAEIGTNKRHFCLSDGVVEFPSNGSGVLAWSSHVGIKNDEQLVCLSDEVVEYSISSRGASAGDSRAGMENDDRLEFLFDDDDDDAAAGSSSDGGEEEDPSRSPRGTSGGLKTIQLVHARPVLNSTAVSGPLGDAVKLIDSKNCTPSLSDVVSDYLAGESSSSSEGDLESKRGSPSPSATHSSAVRPTIRRLVRINLPDDTLHNMQEDTRFDGVCHAWVRRPDFCRWGVNCDFSHEYPPLLAKKYGMIAVYVRANGKEVKNAEEFLKLEEAYIESKWTKLNQGAKVHSPGCYKENCRAFLRNDCTYGDKCWYKHPKTIVEDGKWVTKDVRRLLDGKHRTFDGPNEKEKVDIGDGFWGDRQSSIHPVGQPSSSKRSSISHDNSPRTPVRDGGGVGAGPGRSWVSPTLAMVVNSTTSTAIPWTTAFPKHSPTVISPTEFRSDKDYNYWGEESAVHDGANYWDNALPSRISRLASREQAFAVEAMTYKQLVRSGSRKEVCKETQRLHRAPRAAASGFAGPVLTRRDIGSRKIMERRISITHVRQGNEEEKDKVEIRGTRRERVRTRERPSRGNRNTVHDTKQISTNNGYDTAGSGSDWTKSFKAMLAQKCESTRWEAGRGKRGTLIEF